MWLLRGVWGLLSFVLSFTGRVVAILIGVALLMVGAVLTLTVVGAAVGIPLILFGFLLIVRGFF